MHFTPLTLHKEQLHQEINENNSTSIECRIIEENHHLITKTLGAFAFICGHWLYQAISAERRKSNVIKITSLDIVGTWVQLLDIFISLSRNVFQIAFCSLLLGHQNTAFIMELLSLDIIEIILEAPEKRVPLSPLVTAAWTSLWTLQWVGLEAEANSNPGGGNSLSKEEEELSSRVPEAWAPGGRGRREEWQTRRTTMDCNLYVPATWLGTPDLLAPFILTNPSLALP